MMGRATNRHTLYRQRRRLGARIVRVEILQVHIEALARRGYLDAPDSGGREAIGRALSTFIDDTLCISNARGMSSADTPPRESAEPRALDSSLPQATLAVCEPSGTAGPSGRPQTSARPKPPQAVPPMSRPHGIVPAGLEAELFPEEPDATARPVPRRPSAAEELSAGLFDDGVPPREDHGPTTGSKSATGTWPSDAEIVAAYPSIFAAYYVAALRDRRMRGWWTDRHSQMVNDRDPIPEDFMRPAEALRMREFGDPLEALRRRRGDS